ncbi:hypothetical protein L6452_34461 [Arctium lappa]|uniref:Uncharacterized protein n=1 Tax=Arctium lappa TaxID=4217 RepID=A0ACB8YIV4_ARCLA|nr:hypothetical protein L6452_34461 [Arctium lappa]
MDDSGSSTTTTNSGGLLGSGRQWQKLLNDIKLRKLKKVEMVVRKVGKYEVGRTIGEGTFAKVKFAQNTETGDSVTMKLLDRASIIKHKMVTWSVSSSYRSHYMDVWLIGC